MCVCVLNPGIQISWQNRSKNTLIEAVCNFGIMSEISYLIASECIEI